jgi:hypothetical protein
MHRMLKSLLFSPHDITKFMKILFSPRRLVQEGNVRSFNNDFSGVVHPSPAIAYKNGLHGLVNCWIP